MTNTTINNHIAHAPDADDDTSDLVVESLDTKAIWDSWNAKGQQGQRRASAGEHDDSARRAVERAE